jgi:hypothetical protein
MSIEQNLFELFFELFRTVRAFSFEQILKVSKSVFAGMREKLEIFKSLQRPAFNLAPRGEL